MAYPRSSAEDFAREMAGAISDLHEELHVWQVAAERAGLPDSEVRVLHETGLVFLVGQEWVVHHDGSDWAVRPWQGEQDDLYDDALDMGALDEPEDQQS